jgi:hypothetical protein
MKLLSSSRARYCREPGTKDASRHTDKSKDSVWARLDALCTVSNSDVCFLRFTRNVYGPPRTTHADTLWQTHMSRCWGRRRPHLHRCEKRAPSLFSDESDTQITGQRVARR